MTTCDICNAEMGFAETTAYSIDDLDELIRRGFGPADKVVRMAMSAGWTREQVVARWQQELDARPKPYWMFCPACAKRANRYMPAEEVLAAGAPETEVVPETPAAEASPVKSIAGETPAAEPAAGAPALEEEPAAEEESEEEPELAGKRPRTGRILFIGLLIGLLGGVAFSLLVLDRTLHPVTPTPVPTMMVVLQPSATSAPTRVLPTRRPATPRPTEALYPPTVIPVPDLSGVALELGDMPTGFREMADSRRETLGLTAETLAPAFDLAQGRLRQFGAQDYRTTGEFVVSFLVYPLAPAEQESFDQGLDRPDAGLAPLWATLSPHGWITPTRVADLYPYGESGVWMSSVGSGDADGLVLEVFAARRGPVLEFILLGYPEGGDFELNPVDPLELLDARLAVQVPPPYVPDATPYPTMAVPPALSNAVLRKEDFPLGFATPTASELAELNFEAAMSDTEGFAEAQIENLTVFFEPGSDAGVMVVSWLFYPLTEFESYVLQKGLREATYGQEPALLGIDESQWRSVRALEGLEEVGEAAYGSTGVDVSSRPAMRVDVAVVSRGRAAIMIMVMYVDGTDPRVDVIELAEVLDRRVKAALGGP